MNISDLAEDYLIDRKEGMRTLTASFLNEVMQREAENQIQARHYERTGKRKAYRNRHAIRVVRDEIYQSEQHTLFWVYASFGRCSNIVASVHGACATGNHTTIRMPSKYRLDHGYNYRYELKFCIENQ